MLLALLYRSEALLDRLEVALWYSEIWLFHLNAKECFLLRSGRGLHLSSKLSVLGTWVNRDKSHMSVLQPRQFSQCYCKVVPHRVKRRERLQSSLPPSHWKCLFSAFNADVQWHFYCSYGTFELKNCIALLHANFCTSVSLLIGFPLCWEVIITKEINIYSNNLSININVRRNF